MLSIFCLYVRHSYIYFKLFTYNSLYLSPFFNFLSHFLPFLLPLFIFFLHITSGEIVIKYLCCNQLGEIKILGETVTTLVHIAGDKICSSSDWSSGGWGVLQASPFISDSPDTPPHCTAVADFHSRKGEEGVEGDISKLNVHLCISGLG
jgi:hypothetical protein